MRQAPPRPADIYVVHQGDAADRFAWVVAERLRDEFLHAKLNVEWQPFRGGHEIPELVLRRLGLFITKVFA